MSLLHQDLATDVLCYFSRFLGCETDAFLVQVNAFKIFVFFFCLRAFNCSLEVSSWVSWRTTRRVFTYSERSLGVYLFWLDNISIRVIFSILGNSPRIILLLQNCRLGKRMPCITCNFILLPNLYIRKCSNPTLSLPASFLTLLPDYSLISFLKISQMKILILLLRRRLGTLSL